MKLGIKQLYNDSPFRKLRIRPSIDEFKVFYNNSFNAAKYSFFYCRCYRIFTGLLKTLAPLLYDSLHKKVVDPSMLFLYSILTLGVG